MKGFFASVAAMALEPVKIPQNVYIEDRIVGPITLKQVIILTIGCGFSYALYASLTKAAGPLPLPLTLMVWSPGMIAAVFAFVKINDLSMLRICLLTIERMNKPSTRTWTPRRGITINIRTPSSAANEQTENERKAAQEAAMRQRMRIGELSALLDRTAPEDEESEADVTAKTAAPPVTASAEPRASVPVNPARVRVSDEGLPPVDDVRRPAVSLFRDVSPPSA